jgi:hypothetical protein
MKDVCVAPRRYHSDSSLKNPMSIGEMASQISGLGIAAIADNEFIPVWGETLRWAQGEFPEVAK